MSHALTRRDFVAGTAALGAVALARPAFAQNSPNWRVAYFSDSHILTDRLVSENRVVLEEIMTHRPDFLINGGDIVDSGWESEYRNWKSMTADLGAPAYAVPGNHDVRWSRFDADLFEKYCGPRRQLISRKGVHFLLLDSTCPLSHWGHFGADDLAWIKRTLDPIPPEEPVFVFAHHWMGRERVVVDNELTLLEILNQRNVKLICSGHGHSDLLWSWSGIASTMNKRLWQGSYEIIEIQPEAGKAVLYRRTEEQKELTVVTEIPLAWTKREKGDMSQTGPKLSRVNDGVWEEGSPNSNYFLPGLNLITHQESSGLVWGHELEMLPEDPVKMDWRVPVSGAVMSRLALRGDLLALSTMSGTLEVRNRTNGNLVFKRDLGGYCQFTPLIEGNRVYQGSSNGILICADLQSGREFWRRDLQTPLYGGAVLAEGRLLLGTADGRFLALDPQTGRTLWTHTLEDSPTSFVQAVPVADLDRVYFTSWNSRLTALNLSDGSLAWRVALVEGGSYHFAGAITSPCVVGNRVYAVGNSNALNCYDADDGKLLWSRTTNGDKFGQSSPVHAQGRLYVGCLGDKGQVRCLDASNGRELWMTSTGQGNGSEIYDSTPAIGDGHLAILSVNGNLHVLGTTTGRKLSSIRLGDGTGLSTAACTGKSIYASSFSGFLWGFTRL